MTKKPYGPRTSGTALRGKPKRHSHRRARAAELATKSTETTEPEGTERSHEQALTSARDAAHDAATPQEQQKVSAAPAAQGKETSSSTASTPKIEGGAPKTTESGSKKIDPTLRAFFGPEPLKVQTFVKAIRDAKIQRFGADDLAVIDGLIAANDKEAARLWQLVVGASSLPPVAAWIWPFIHGRVKATVGAQGDLVQEPPPQILHNVVMAISGDLRSDDREKARRAENELRLTIAWLVERRNATPDEVAGQIRHIFLGTATDGEERVRKALATGSKAELQATVAAFRIAEEQVQKAQHERDTERQLRHDLKNSLDALREQATTYAEAIQRLQAEKAQLEQLLHEERTRAHSDRRYHAHSSSQTRADFSTSLQRIRGLVEEAGEAVGIAMKRSDERSLRGLQAAERKIISAIDAITETDR